MFKFEGLPAYVTKSSARLTREEQRVIAALGHENLRISGKKIAQFTIKETIGKHIKQNPDRFIAEQWQRGAAVIGLYQRLRGLTTLPTRERLNINRALVWASSQSHASAARQHSMLVHSIQQMLTGNGLTAKPAPRVPGDVRPDLLVTAPGRSKVAIFVRRDPRDVVDLKLYETEHPGHDIVLVAQLTQTPPRAILNAARMFHTFTPSADAKNLLPRTSGVGSMRSLVSFLR